MVFLCTCPVVSALIGEESQEAISPSVKRRDILFIQSWVATTTTSTSWSQTTWDVLTAAMDVKRWGSVLDMLAPSIVATFCTSTAQTLGTPSPIPSSQVASSISSARAIPIAAVTRAAETSMVLSTIASTKGGTCTRAVRTWRRSYMCKRRKRTWHCFYTRKRLPSVAGAARSSWTKVQEAGCTFQGARSTTSMCPVSRRTWSNIWRSPSLVAKELQQMARSTKAEIWRSRDCPGFSLLAEERAERGEGLPSSRRSCRSLSASSWRRSSGIRLHLLQVSS